MYDVSVLYLSSKASDEGYRPEMSVLLALRGTGGSLVLFLSIE